MTYALHIIQLPAGWSPAISDRSSGIPSRPISAIIGRNGAVAVLIAPTGTDSHMPRRLLIVRANGTSTILRSSAVVAAFPFRHIPKASDCLTDGRDCPFFKNVVFARDGTPFVTLAYFFSGAYSGIDESAFAWNGAWHIAPRGKAFSGVGKPDDPDNVAIAAAETATTFAFVGNYYDMFPNEDLDLAARDRYYMADVSGAEYDGRNIALGLGDATAMRGAYVAGFDAGLKLVAGVDPRPTTAVAWRCVLSVAASGHPCARYELGPGVAYGIDSRGDAVGDDGPFLRGQGDVSSYTGSPVLWRRQKPLRLWSGHGCAYAISEAGTIVGVSEAGGFIADAHDARPRARSLDELVPTRGNRHVQAAFGIADDESILALVAGEGGRHDLAVLVPQHAKH